MTGLRLPSYFHIPFGIVTHPKSKAPWHLPRLPFQAPSNPVNDEVPNGQRGGSFSHPLESDTPTTLKSPIRTLSGTHFLASRHVLAHVSALTPVQYKRLLPYRWKHDTSVKLPEIIWREDMDIFVLEILRRNVLKTLCYLASRPAAYIAPCKASESVNEHSQVAAVLWLRKPPDTSLNDKTATSEAISFNIGKTGPPPHAMHYYKTRYIPYYNLPALLGPSRLSALQKDRPDHYGEHFAVVKLKRTTVRVQLELWKLLGYMTRDGNYG